MKMLMNKRLGNRRYIILWNNGWFDFSRFGEKMVDKEYVDEKEIDKFIEKLKKINNK